MTAATLPIPEEIPAEGGDGVTELARVWWNGNQPAMMIRPALRDPELMGGVLAELAKGELAGVPGLSDQLERLKPRMDYDALFAEAMRGVRPP